MIVTLTDIQNAIYKAQNMVYAIALNITDCYEQGSPVSDEKYELATELQSYIDVLGRVDLDENDCIDSDEVWNIISWINGNQVLAEMCLAIPAQYSNPGQPIPVPDSGCCGVETVTGPQVDNTNPKHPVVGVYGDGVTITGAGTQADPFVAVGGGGGSGTVSSGAQYRLAYYAAAGNTVSNAPAITAARALKSDANGVPTHFDTATEPSLTELTYVKGVTSAIQTQLNAKAPIASPTFTGTATAPTVNVSGLTASELVATDGSKNLQSLAVATYPSLAELAFVKGVTSAIQTQLNAKVDNGAVTGGDLTMNTSRILGRTTAAAGAIEELTVGTGLTLSGGSLSVTGSPRSIYMVLGDQSTSSNVASDITELVFSVQANKRYFIRGHIRVGCNNTGGVKIAATVPAGATFYNALFGRSVTTTPASVAIGAINSSGSLSTPTFIVVNNAFGFIEIAGEFTINATAGNVQFQFASGTNTQTSTVYQQGTQITVQELP